MPALNQARVPARGADGAIQGYLRIALLPRAATTSPPPLLVTANNPDADELQEPIQLLEGFEYLYEWEQLPAFAKVVATDPEEVFQPDTTDGLKGRMRPCLSNGTLHVDVRNN